jgi:hypothetical protein
MQLRRLEIVDTWEQESVKMEQLESKELGWLPDIISLLQMTFFTYPC